MFYCIVCVDANVMSVSDSYYNCNGPDIIWLGGHYKTGLAKDITTLEDMHINDKLHIFQRVVEPILIFLRRCTFWEQLSFGQVRSCWSHGNQIFLNLCYISSYIVQLDPNLS